MLRTCVVMPYYFFRIYSLSCNVSPPRHSAGPVDEGTDEVVEETRPGVAEDGERAMPEASVEVAVAGGEPVEDATDGVGKRYSRVKLSKQLYPFLLVS